MTEEEAPEALDPFCALDDAIALILSRVTSAHHSMWEEVHLRSMVLALGRVQVEADSPVPAVRPIAGCEQLARTAPVLLPGGGC